jgi:HAD superfamily hydrolase (TIGR01549 family)
MPRPFDLITFDFDGVLLHNNYNELILDACRTLGLRWDPARERELVRFIHDYYGTGAALRDLTEHGREGFWAIANRRFTEALQAEGLTDEMIPQMIARIQQAEPLFYYETGIHELLHDLRDQGYRLAMLTNRDDRINEFGAEWGFIEHFDLIGTSQTVGKPKPEPDLFHYIAEHFNVAPGRALHIGDNPYADVVGARAAGWRCILIDPDDLFPDWDVPRIPTIHDLLGWLGGQENKDR